MNQQPDVHKMYLYAKDPYEAKYQFQWKKDEDVGAKHFDDLMILKLLSNTQMIWMIFIKILKNISKIKNVKHKYFLMIWLLIC